MSSCQSNFCLAFISAQDCSDLFCSSLTVPWSVSSGKSDLCRDAKNPLRFAQVASKQGSSSWGKLPKECAWFSLEAKAAGQGTSLCICSLKICGVAS